MAEETSEQGLVIKLDRTNVPKSASFVDVYANDTLLQVTAWDARFMFGVITEPGLDQTKVGIVRVADVRMSLQHAKRVAQLLNEHIKRYEDQHGQLKIPGDGKD
jgi:hypothetical protein